MVVPHGRTRSYGYNHANLRVFVRNGNTVTYYFHGSAGERLMDMEETCTTSCTAYVEKERWIYFAGRKMFSKAGTGPLKAVAPNRLASEAKHFPYGELQGAAPADTKDYFATYRRDGTALDYAWNRYYSSTMGRFTTADPYGGSARPAVPDTWNRYSYVSNNPGNYTDPKGLFLETYSGPGAAWIICAMNPFAAMSTNAGACSTSGYSEEMWSIMGPWNPIISDLPPTPVPSGRGGIFQSRFPQNRSGFAKTIAIAAAPPIVIAIGPTFTITVTVVAVGALVYYFTRGDTFPSLEDLVRNCTPGQTVTEPAKGVRYRGGVSVEQEYICPPGISFTIHTIYDKNGRVVHQHVRPGGPRGGGGIPREGEAGRDGR